jgi:hypothetical protein
MPEVAELSGASVGYYISLCYKTISAFEPDELSDAFKLHIG